MPVFKNDGGPVVFDRAGMLERLMGDEDLARKLIEAFLNDIPKRFQILRECLGKGDVKGVERLTHLLKGAAASVGGDALTAVAGRMEKTSRAGDLSGVKEGVDRLEYEFDRLKEMMEKEF